jgi:hypothetical protein
LSSVSYTSMLEREPGGRAHFDPLPEDAISTRRRDAKRELRVRVSKEQAAFLKEIEETAGDGVDAGATVRALLDLAMRLDVDWALLAGGAGVRRAVRDAVRVRRAG